MSCLKWTFLRMLEGFMRCLHKISALWGRRLFPSVILRISIRNPPNFTRVWQFGLTPKFVGRFLISLARRPMGIL
jgi:hypothetical protein